MARLRMPRLMNQSAGFMLCGALVAPSLFAATKEPERPDREMLRMMELLKDMEMLQQVEMMRDMHEADNAGAAPGQAGVRKTPPSKNKGTPK